MRKTLLSLGFLIVSILCLMLPHNAKAISINERKVEASVETTHQFVVELKRVLQTNPKGKLHGLATFSRHVAPEERTLLAKKHGIVVLEPYQNTTYWVSVTKLPKVLELQSLKLSVNLIKIIDQDRVHPKIWNGSFNDFVVILPNNQPFNYVHENGNLKLTVRFHVDVSEAQGKAILNKYTQDTTPKSPITWVVSLPTSALTIMAKEDFVQWIEAGPLPFLPENDNTRRVVRVDDVQSSNPLSTWGGSGVKVGVFDSGIAENHPDFGKRVSPFDSAIPVAGDDHGTLVAGTIAGQGLQSEVLNSNGCSMTGDPYQWRGMAPQARMIEQSSSNGDSPSVYQSLIASPGMQISNHSYVISDLDGEYSQKDRDRDAMIRGSAPGLSMPARLSVLSAGNQGKQHEDDIASRPQRYLRQKGYFSLTKQLKNGLVVGNVTAVDDDPPTPTFHVGEIFRTSSLGPTYDGRIKPDVVAPGTRVHSTAGPDTTIQAGCTSYYLGVTGTSASAAAVSGSIALLLQRYSSVYNVTDLDTLTGLKVGIPLPSTLRAVMIHTATDSEHESAWFCNADGPPSIPCPVGGQNPDQNHASVWAREGPDFVTGWGVIDVQAAMAVVDQKLLLEDSLPYTCSRKTFAFSVTSAGPLRITLAWDDMPASPQIPTTDLKLINDLDLVLIDPDGTSHYPWRLNQNIYDSSNVLITDPALETCTTSVNVVRQVNPTLTPWSQNDAVPSDGFPPAERNKTDHLNNVEVVEVANPTTGTWQAQVVGFKTPWGPQSYSLVGAEFVDTSTTPETNCKIHGIICSAITMVMICQTSPQVCTNNVAYYSQPKPGDGWIRLKFDSNNEKIIIPVTKLCGLGFDCAPCFKLRTCQRSFVRVDSKSPPELEVEIFTAKGKLLRNNYAKWKNNQTSVQERDLLVAIKPTKFLIPGRGFFEAKIQLSDHMIP